MSDADTAYQRAVDKWEIEVRALSSKHDAHHFEINQAINSYAHLGIKSLYLINGGALSLIPIYASHSILGKDFLRESLSSTLWLFICSIVLTAFCNLMAYFTEGARANYTNKAFETEYALLNKKYFYVFSSGIDKENLVSSEEQLELQRKSLEKTWESLKGVSMVAALTAFVLMFWGLISLFRLAFFFGEGS